MKKTVLIVSHDAGGAEILSAWVRKNNQYHYFYFLEGPAVRVFQSKIENFMNHSDEELLSLVLKSDFVLSSTSWTSDLERNAIRISKENGIRVVSYLDHWIHYQERFMLNGNSVLPDEIWVGDRYAETIAAQYFPSHLIKYEENQYFLEVLEKIKIFSYKKASNDDAINILFLEQPIDNASRYLQSHKKELSFSERDVFRLFIKSIQMAQKKVKINKIFIRPHPSSGERFSDDLLKNYFNDIDIQLSDEPDLILDCMRSDWVVGAFSMAMVIALLAGKKVFSCVPGEIASCLPHKEIVGFEKYVETL